MSTSPIEIRGAAAVNGQTTQGFGAFGAGGFNSPSLLGVAYSGPYFHDGSRAHARGRGGAHRLGDAPATIASALTAQQLADLLAFVRSIDDDTATLPNATDLFIAPMKSRGTVLTSTSETVPVFAVSRESGPQPFPESIHGVMRSRDCIDALRPGREAGPKRVLLCFFLRV